VPAGLGGDRVLFKASCGVCKKKIDLVETACLENMLRDIRYRRGIGNRGVDKRPNDLEVWVTVKEDGSGKVVPPGLSPPEAGWEKRRRPYPQHPTFCMLPVFKLPGITRQVPVRDCNETNAFIRPWWHREQFEVGEPPPKAMWTETKFDSLMFVRMIAKIAHGVAVWEFGLENIESALPPLILGDDPSLAFYRVGGVSADLPPASTPRHLEIGCTTTREIHVLVRLFADLGAPAYLVVVGRHLNKLPF
jgi:hypothetical protein